MAMFTMWLYLGSAIALGLASLAVAAWALFTDRSRGRRRCCKCWYDMQANPSLRCPECGHVVKIEKHLFRTRRRWRGVAAAGVLLMLGAFLAIQPKVQPHGYASLTPVTVLIGLGQFSDAQWIDEALVFHMTYDLFQRPRPDGRPEAMWAWQWRWMGRRGLERLADDNVTWPRRTTYITWVAYAREFGRSAELTRAARVALAKEMAHDDPNVRWHVAWMLVDHADIETSLAHLSRLMEDVDPNVRHGAVMSMARAALHHRRALTGLAQSLQHEQPGVRSSALMALDRLAANYGPHEGVRQAIFALQNDPDCDTRRRAFVAGSKWQTEDDAWASIGKAMSSDDLCRRRGGYDAAMDRWSEPDDILRLIVDGLTDDDVTVRERSVLALSHPQRDFERLLPYRHLFEACLHDDDLIVRTVAQLILDRIEQR